jgi:prephenate dehydratase
LKEENMKSTYRSEVAIMGQPGSYHEAAAIQMGTLPSEIRYMGSFGEVFSAFEAGRVAHAIVAIVNSTTGNVVEPYRYVQNNCGRSARITLETDVRVEHRLLGILGSKYDSSIPGTVVSHEQALKQCSGFLSRSNFTIVQSSDTANAAIEVAQRRDPSVFAIASEEALGINGLCIVKKNVMDFKNNYTRFVRLNHGRHSKNNSDPTAHKTSLHIKVPERCAGLKDVAGAFSDQGIEGTHIASEYIPGTRFNIDFVYELNHGAHTDRMKNALIKLGNLGIKYRVLGSYRVV